MSPSVKPWVYRLVAIGLGLLIYLSLPTMFTYGWILSRKVAGHAPACVWSELLRVYGDAEELEKRHQQYTASFPVKDYDSRYGIELVATPQRSFWVKKAGSKWNGQQLIAYLLSEQDMVAGRHAEHLVRPGNIVLDCGAHVGTFTHWSLQRGAEKVVAIEPDPVNLECLRRNFPAEIASGKVIIAPVGVWSSEGTFKLSIADVNSGMNSLVRNRGGKTIDVRTTTIDLLIEELKLPRVDYIKMDIEGAEREALRGGFDTMRRFKPRLMIEAYHLPDDSVVLPPLIVQANAQYQPTCGPCEPADESFRDFIPHVMFYR